VRARGELLASRAKSTTEYLGKLVADGAKSAQDNFAKVYTKTA
ncbi:MAG: phasin, partial [Alphaproteobacteria bacterium]